jgi:hypothetical protein
MFKSVVLILLTVVFILLTLFLHTGRVAGQAPASSPAAASVSPVVVTDGWRVRALVLNNLGTVVFSGGQNPYSADGIVIVNSEEFVKFATVGDSVPGFESKVFVGFNGPLSLNDRDEVAFFGAFMTRPDASNVYQRLSGQEQASYGLFVYSKGKISKVIATGDELPETAGGTFSFPYALLFNNRGEVLFSAKIQASDNSYSGGLFTYSSGRLRKVALQGDPTPLGFPFRFDTNQFNKILFNDEGVMTFSAGAAPGAGGVNPYSGVFHSSGTGFIKDLAAGDPSPGGRTFLSLGFVAANGEGDIAFNASFGRNPSDQALFLRRRDGTIVQIIADGDPSPIGGTFTLWYTATEYHRGISSTYTASALVPPQLDRSGNVVFAAPIKGSNTTGAIFLYGPDGIRTVAADGDLLPQTNAKVVFFRWQNPESASPQLLTSVGYTISDLGTVSFTSALNANYMGPYGLFQSVGGMVRKLAESGDTAPGTDHKTFAVTESLLQNDRGDVALLSGLCCGSFTEGIFLSTHPGLQIPNGNFELAGDSGLPASWQTVWHNSGDGDAFRFSGDGADALKGTSVLRLHVSAGGGSTFVLSDEIPIPPDSTYILSSWMRYNLSSAESVFFSVLQFDTSGNVVGFDEVRGISGENDWHWKPERLLIHTTPVTSSVRIRFGLISDSESYLDVDAVQ